jgi:hypothetical protein
MPLINPHQQHSPALLRVGRSARYMACTTRCYDNVEEAFVNHSLQLSHIHASQPQQVDTHINKQADINNNTSHAPLNQEW